MTRRIARRQPLLVGDEETIQIGITQGNAIAHAVYAAVPDLVLPTPIPCSRCLHPKAEPKEKPQS